MKKTASIILAAGKGTRMKSEKPKVVFQLAGKPMINRVIETAEKVDCEMIVLVVGYKKESVMDVVPKKDKIKFVEQKVQNGTAHAVSVTKDVFHNFYGDILILCGDVPLLRSETLRRILQQHRKHKAACTVLTAFMNDPLKYGRIVRNADNSIRKIIEYKDATGAERKINEINTGIYCFDSESLFSALGKVNSDNKQNEFYLPDTLEILISENKIVTSVSLEDMVEASGVNSKEELAELELEFLRRQQ